MAGSFINTIMKGLATSMGARVVTMGMRFVTLCLLPIWIAPNVIGYAAVLMATTNLIVTLSDMGFGTALVKNKTCPQKMYQSVFTLTMALGALIALGLILGAPLFENVFQVPAYLVIIAAFAIPVSSLTIVPNALLHRELKFAGLAFRDFLGELAFSGTAIGLALARYSELAVPCALVAQRFVRWLSATCTVNWRPTLKLDKSSIAELFKFSMYQFGNTSLSQLANRLDTFLLSVFLSPTSLGFYAQGQQLSTSPMEALSSAMRNVLFASFSKVQNDEKQLHALFVKLMKYLIVASFVAAACFYPALGLIPIVYDPSWAPSVEIGRILCFSIPLYAMMSIEGILITVGGEKRRLVTTLTRTCIMTVGICALFGGFPSCASSKSIAWLVLVSMTVSVILNLSYLMPYFHITRQDARQWAMPALASAVIMALSILMTNVFGG